jgi:MFS family permease
MPQSAVVICAGLLVLIAAARSTWSPCGISMLSTLTPHGERSRGHRYAATAAWFVAGAVLGGAALGGVIAALAAVVAVISPSAATVAAVTAIAAAVCVASDLRLGGFHLPLVPRQVNEVWVGGYRRWVYAAGFGAQIGAGLSTYVMTAAVYLVIVIAALTASPALGALLGIGFGLARGLAILLGARLTSPAAIRRFHERFEGLGPASLAVAIAAQVGVLGYAATMTGTVGVLVLVVVTAALVATALRRRTVVRRVTAASST